MAALALFAHGFAVRRAKTSPVERLIALMFPAGLETDYAIAVLHEVVYMCNTPRIKAMKLDQDEP